MNGAGEGPDDLRVDIGWPELDDRSEAPAPRSGVMHRRRPAPPPGGADAAASPTSIEELGTELVAIRAQLSKLSGRVADLGRLVDERTADLADTHRQGNADLVKDVAEALAMVADRLERLVARNEDVDSAVRAAGDALDELSAHLEGRAPAPQRSEVVPRNSEGSDVSTVLEAVHSIQRTLAARDEPASNPSLPAGIYPAVAEQLNVLAFEVAALRRRIWAGSLAPVIDEAAVDAIVDRLVRRLRQGY